MVRILKEDGELGLLKGLITIEGSCNFAKLDFAAADFDNIPYLALKGDYTVVSPQCQDTLTSINARRAMGQGTAKATTSHWMTRRLTANSMASRT